MKRISLIIIIILVLLIVIPLVTAADFTFKQNTIVDLKLQCFTVENNVCNEATNCTILINKPNGDLLLYNNMTRYPLYYNITLNETHTEEGGLYDGTMFCISNATSVNDKYGNIKITFEITNDGFSNEPNTGLYISLTLLFIFFVSAGILFYFWRGEKEHD